MRTKDHEKVTPAPCSHTRIRVRFLAMGEESMRKRGNHRTAVAEEGHTRRRLARGPPPPCHFTQLRPKPVSAFCAGRTANTSTNLSTAWAVFLPYSPAAFKRAANRDGTPPTQPSWARRIIRHLDIRRHHHPAGKPLSPGFRPPKDNNHAKPTTSHWSLAPHRGPAVLACPTTSTNTTRLSTASTRDYPAPCTQLASPTIEQDNRVAVPVSQTAPTPEFVHATTDLHLRPPPL